MSDNLTPQQQLQTDLILFLVKNADSRSWVDFWNPNTLINRELTSSMFEAMDKDSKLLFRNVLQQNGVVIDQNGVMTFPENYLGLIPRIVEEYMKRRSAQATHAVAEAPHRRVCAGGGAVAEAPHRRVCAGGGAIANSSTSHYSGWFSPFVDRSGWGVTKPKDAGKCVAGGGIDNVCPMADGGCSFYNTWGGCKKEHPTEYKEKAVLPEKGGPKISVCRNGKSCKTNGCTFPHPQNDTCIVVKNDDSGVSFVKICTLPVCKIKNCPCAHLPKDVVSMALDRKQKSKKSLGGGIAASCKDSQNQVSRIADDLWALSIEECQPVQPHAPSSPFCGEGACGFSFEKPQPSSVSEVDLPGICCDAHVIPQSRSPLNPPSPSAPVLRPNYGQWEEMINPVTGDVYYQSDLTGEVIHDSPKDFIRDACRVGIHDSPEKFIRDACRVFVAQAVPESWGASCVVLAQAVHESSSASCLVVAQAVHESSSASCVVVAQAVPESSGDSCVVVVPPIFSRPTKRELGVSPCENVRRRKVEAQSVEAQSIVWF